MTITKFGADPAHASMVSTIRPEAVRIIRTDVDRISVFLGDTYLGLPVVMAREIAGQLLALAAEIESERASV